ncbi:MAG: peptidoglycan-associated lipoprotein, partial [Rhodobacteraceae bacterium]|nr:peptidoglycan-associated lipoprotein [Paracoccaceae bacterium]
MTYLTKSAAILALLATAACTDTTGGLFGGGGSDINGAGIGSIDEASLEYFQASIGSTVLFAVDQSS